MAIQRTDAIVLRKRDFRETSIIVNFYTRSFGKFSGILKGIRKDPQKFASTVEQFSYNEIIFYETRNSGLHLVSQCDLKDNFNILRGDIQRIGMASLAVELVDAVMAEEDKNEEVFELILTTLSLLANTSNPDKVMTIFKIKILSLSGFKPNLDSCVVCGSRIFDEPRFSLSLGGLICGKCQLSNRNTSTRSIFKGTIATILHIQKNDFKANLNLGMNPQIKKELDLVLSSFLTYHLDKELKSQKVLNKLDNFVPAAL